MLLICLLHTKKNPLYFNNSFKNAAAFICMRDAQNSSMDFLSNSSGMGIASASQKQHLEKAWKNTREKIYLKLTGLI